MCMTLLVEAMCRAHRSRLALPLHGLPANCVRQGTGRSLPAGVFAMRSLAMMLRITMLQPARFQMKFAGFSRALLVSASHSG
jgi:hypothetical protein